MSFFSRFLGGRQSKLERELHDMYANMLCTVAGYQPAQAEQTVSEAIAMCKQEANAEGTANLPEGFGDRMIEAASIGEPKSKRIIDRARQEGATDDDIREWWNLPDLCCRMVVWSENLFRTSVFLSAIEDDGLSAEDAAARVHQIFPLYGDPEDTSKLSGDNRPIPHELRSRVESYHQMRGAEYIADQVKGFSSYNAFVRHAIQEGLI